MTSSREGATNSALEFLVDRVDPVAFAKAVPPVAIRRFSITATPRLLAGLASGVVRRFGRPSEKTTSVSGAEGIGFALGGLKVAEASLTSLLKERAATEPGAAGNSFIDHGADRKGTVAIPNPGRTHQRAEFDRLGVSA